MATNSYELLFEGYCSTLYKVYKIDTNTVIMINLKIILLHNYRS